MHTLKNYLLLLIFFAVLQACNLTKIKTKTAILTSSAPAPMGPYSQAILKGNMLFVSGQIAINPVTNTLDTANITKETRQVMENIKAILQQADMNFNHVIKTTIYLTDIGTFNQVNEVYATYMLEMAPARETVEVQKLPRGAHIEISVIAIKD